MIWVCFAVEGIGHPTVLQLTINPSTYSRVKYEAWVFNKTMIKTQQQIQGIMSKIWIEMDEHCVLMTY